MDDGLHADLELLGGRRWIRTTGPSLVRIATTTPPPLLTTCRRRSELAEASTGAQESALARYARSHLRSHPRINSAVLPPRSVLGGAAPGS
jgi:hypothetical protein